MILTQEYRAQWPHLTKIVFRFFALYFGLYILFMFLGSSLFSSFFIWVGKTILQSDGRLEYFPTGSGDTTMGYISLLVQTVLAILGTIIWSILDRKRDSYNKFFYWFLVFLRGFLILFLLSYGFAKIFKTQFPDPSLTRLLQPIGEMSPMGLAWTYMGYSEGFNFVVGFFEALGGFLLIPRRTQTFGAFVAAGVMFQVFLMNMFFDIPVKIFSFHLLIMALFIFTLDARRFVNIFIKNKATEVYEFYNPIKDKLYHKIIFWFKICAVLTLVGFMSYNGYNRERGAYGDKREKPPFYGIWEVDSFTINEEEHPPLLTDTLRWRYLIVDYPDRATVKTMDDNRKFFTFTPDSAQTKITLYQGEWNQEKNNFSVEVDDDNMSLNGLLNSDTLSIELKKKDLSKSALLGRGFHWVNEYPYNR